MREGTLRSELAVSLFPSPLVIQSISSPKKKKGSSNKPWYHLCKVLARRRIYGIVCGMQERTRRAGLASSLAEELAWDVFSICALVLAAISPETHSEGYLLLLAGGFGGLRAISNGGRIPPFSF